MNKTVFSKSKINNMELKNRFIRSAAGSGIATEEGHVTEDVIERFAQKARGGPGLIITEMMTAWDDGNFPEDFLRIDDDSYMEGLSELTGTVHTNGSKIVCQLGNYGTLLEGEPFEQPLSPSSVPNPVSGITGKEMTAEDICFVRQNFLEAAVRSKKAGFDGVQINAAHGFLLSQFLSPFSNLRTDEYGGPIDNRLRLILEILDEIKSGCGNDYPVLIKLNGSDFMDDHGGFTFSDCRKAAAIISEAGYDAIEVSGGITGGDISPARSGEAYHREFAEIIAGEISCPVILTGGIRRLGLAEEIIRDTGIEFIGMTRALTYTPDLIEKWSNGNEADSACRLCNRCFATEGRYCLFRKGFFFNH